VTVVRTSRQYDATVNTRAGHRPDIELKHEYDSYAPHVIDSMTCQTGPVMNLS
jgi:hypothetical protein